MSNRCNGTATDLPYLRETKAYCEGRALSAAGEQALTFASGTTGVVGDDNAITWTSEVYGDGVQVILLDPGAADEELAVAVSGKTIVVTLETDAQAAIASTALEVYTAVGLDVDASALVAGDDTSTSDGSGVVVAERAVCTGSNVPHEAGSPAAADFEAGFDSWVADPSGVARDCCADAYGGGFGE
jgi:hypothetical protein